MDTLKAVLTIVFVTLFPWLSIELSRRVKAIAMIGPVVLCYAGGALFVNISGLHYVTDHAVLLSDIVLKEITGLSVVVAIPLLLFSTDFVKWLKVAPQAVKSFLLLIFSVMVAGTLSALVFQAHFANPEQAAVVAGMMVGVYTGGTPNLSSIGRALGANAETFVLVNTADVIIGGIYLLLLFTIVKPILSKFLPPFALAASAETIFNEGEGSNEKFWPSVKKIPFLGALGLSLLCVGASFALSLVFPRVNERGQNVPNEIILFVALTTFSIGCSFIRKVRSVKGTFDGGNYLILMFCSAIGLSISLPKLLAAGMTILLYLVCMLLVSITIHFLLCRVFKIDVDTAIITSTAGIYGTPFIVPVADAIKNREVIVSGLTTSLVGYAVGNYLGISLGTLLR